MRMNNLLLLLNTVHLWSENYNRKKMQVSHIKTAEQAEKVQETQFSLLQSEMIGNRVLVLQNYQGTFNYP